MSNFQRNCPDYWCDFGEAKLLMILNANLVSARFLVAFMACGELQAVRTTTVSLKAQNARGLEKR